MIGETTTITLLKHQIEHYEKIMSILEKWFVYIDCSDTGSGKSVVTLAVARTLGLGLVIIAPPVTHAQWLEVASRYDVPVYHIDSYQSMRKPCETKKEITTGIKERKRQLVVHRPDQLSLDGKSSSSAIDPMIHTRYYEKLLQKGIIIVFDEFQAVKTTTSLQSEVAHALIKPLVLNPDMISRAALLSATPCDHQRNAISILKMTGICTRRHFLPQGVVEVARVCKMINPMPVGDVMLRYGITSSSDLAPRTMKDGTSVKYAYDIYREVLSGIISSAAKKCCASSSYGSPDKTEDFSSMHKRYSGFFRMEKEDDARLRAAYLAVEQLLQQKSMTPLLSVDEQLEEGLKTDIQEPKTCNITHLSHGFLEIETSKIPTIVRLVTDRLEDSTNYPNEKVILYINYVKNLLKCGELLSKYNPLILNGSTSSVERVNNIEKFQKPTNEFRLLITNPTVGGVGVNLDDVEGTQPRTQYISPSYSFIIMCQIMGRVARSLTKSPSESYLVFSEDVPQELKMIDNLARKAATMRGFILEDETNKMVFPGEYPEYHEF